MKATALVQLMRKVVREEVRSVIQQELTEILKEGLQSTITEIKSPAKATAPKSIKSAPAPARPKRTAPIVTFDGPLGDLLNETAMGMANNQYDEEEWPDMNGGPMTSAHVPQADPSSLMSMMDDEAPLPASTGYGDPTMNFVKDYSAVMKAADAHAGGGR